MRISRWSSCCRRLLFASTALVSCASTRASAEASSCKTGPRPRIDIRDPRIAAAVARAYAEARQRLSNPACAAVAGDFGDLSPGLGGRRPEEHLEQLLFSDAEAGRACQVNQLRSAITSPGWRVVFVCPHFLKVERRDPRRAAADLVHEWLHTLGLGEDPPSSAEINAAVDRRCFPGP